MDAQGWLTLAAVVVPTLAVVITAWLNHRAHEGITTRIDGVNARSERRDEALHTALDGVNARSEKRDEAHRLALESIARDVSFMAGRQTERDRARTTDQNV